MGLTHLDCLWVMNREKCMYRCLHENTYSIIMYPNNDVREWYAQNHLENTALPRKLRLGVRTPANDEGKCGCLMLTGYKMGGKSSFWNICLRNKGYSAVVSNTPSKAQMSFLSHLLFLSWMLIHTDRAAVWVSLKALLAKTLFFNSHLPAEYMWYSSRFTVVFIFSC